MEGNRRKLAGLRTPSQLWSMRVAVSCHEAGWVFQMGYDPKHTSKWVAKLLQGPDHFTPLAGTTQQKMLSGTFVLWAGDGVIQLSNTIQYCTSCPPSCIRQTANRSTTVTYFSSHFSLFFFFYFFIFASVIFFFPGGLQTAKVVHYRHHVVWKGSLWESGLWAFLLSHGFSDMLLIWLHVNYHSKPHGGGRAPLLLFVTKKC